MAILWEGARGPAVRTLQEKLQELHLYAGDLSGVFDKSTTRAVTAFQKKAKYAADGIVGPQTLQALNLSPLTRRSAPSKRSKVFVSYSHADAKWLQMLRVHLAPLERNGIVVAWDDTKIAPGARWKEEIATALQSTKVAVLLVSAYFIASEFISTEELPPLLKAVEGEGAVILPVIISPCVMGSLSDFQSVNPPSKPLVDLNRGDRDRVWVKVVEAITTALND